MMTPTAAGASSPKMGGNRTASRSTAAESLPSTAIRSSSSAGKAGPMGSTPGSLSGSRFPKRQRGFRWRPRRSPGKASPSSAASRPPPIPRETPGLRDDIRSSARRATLLLTSSPLPESAFPPPRSRSAKRAKLLALGSRDPDGEIVLYLWDFGDGKKETSTTTLVRHEFTRSGRYSITLTVIDNQGKSATASGTLRVSGPTSETSPSSSDGCGCGG